MQDVLKCFLSANLEIFVSNRINHALKGVRIMFSKLVLENVNLWVMK